MVESDTIKLLRECDAGVKMGVKSIDDVIGDVRSQEFKTKLSRARCEHESLGDEIRTHLNDLHDKGKDPNPIATGMSWLAVRAKMAIKDSDKTIANLMTDGCNMGVKSLNKYLNQYKAASEEAKDITKRLIKVEDDLAAEIRAFL